MDDPRAGGGETCAMRKASGDERRRSETDVCRGKKGEAIAHGSVHVPLPSGDGGGRRGGETRGDRESQTHPVELLLSDAANRRERPLRAGTGRRIAHGYRMLLR